MTLSDEHRKKPRTVDAGQGEPRHWLRVGGSGSSIRILRLKKLG